MPVDVEHDWQATHNAQLLGEVLLDRSNTRYPDWVITIAFYKAVHVIDRALAGHGIVSVRTHEHRKDEIKKHLRGCLGLFQAFEELSRKARYEVLKPTPNDIDDAFHLLSDIEQIA